MSNRKCCVPGCLNSLDTNANLHKFPNPAKDKELFNTWVYSVGGDLVQLENEHIFKYRRVCRGHFEPKYYCRNNRLSKEAVPTRNMPGLSFLKFNSDSGVLRPLQTSEASTLKDSHRVLHWFPNPEKDIDRFRTWVHVIGGECLSLSNENIYKLRRVCHAHFEEKYCCRYNRISNIAVPTLLKPGPDTTLHQFPDPEKELDRFNRWIYAIGGNALVIDPKSVYKNGRVCHSHFNSKFYTASKRLSKNAVPSLFLSGVPLHYFPCPEKDAERFQNWVTIVGCDIASLDSTTVRKTHRICRRHFQKELLYPNNRLCKLAVPSLLLPSADVSAPSTDTLMSDREPSTSQEAILHRDVIQPMKTITVNPSRVQDVAESCADAGDLGPRDEPKVENTDICDDVDADYDDSDTLVESNVCRVCLALDVKMYYLKDIELREMFHNITGIAVTENNHSILERLCWECAGRLKAAAAFRNKALLSDALLQDLANSGEQIRKNDITLIKENEDYLKSAGALSTVEVFHTVVIDPENESFPRISDINDTEIVQNTVRKDSIELEESIIEEDTDQMAIEDGSIIEAPIETEIACDHICPNTVEENSNIFIKANPVSNNITLREDKINSAYSSPLPGCSHVKQKYSIPGYLPKTPSNCDDKLKKKVIKIKKRDLISRIVLKKPEEFIGDVKLRNINVKIGGISKKTSNLKLIKKTS